MPGDNMDSQAQVEAPGADSGIEGMGSMNEKVAHLVAEITKHPDMPIEEKKKKVLAAFNLLDAPAPPPEVEGAVVGEDDMDGEREEERREEERKEEERERGEEDKMEESIKALRASPDPKNKELAEQICSRLQSLRTKRRELKLLKEAQAFKAAKARARRLCEESALPKEQITEVLLESMANKRNAKSMKAILEDRLAIVNIKKPTSGQGFVGRKHDNTGRKEASDTKSFVESLNKK